MEPVKPVFWYQGLFLQPQHFQQNDIYIQSLLSPLRKYQQPYFWGVCRLEIQEKTLKNLTFELTQGEFIFQDGTWLVLPGNAVIQPRILSKEKLEVGRPFKVYLGLSKLNHTKGNVSVISQPDKLGKIGTRFVSEIDPAEVKDLHQGGQSAPVKLMNYALKIFWENEIENLGDYYLLPVAELEYNEDEITVSRNFVPPLVTVSASETIKQIIQNIREQVTSRCRKLEEYKSPREMQTSEFESTYIVYMLALRSLNRYVSQLYHLTEIPDVHPWQLYGLLRQIIGELSTFTDRIDSLGRLMDGTELLPEYNHENLKTCFEEAQTLIGELLSEIIIGPESIIHLSRKGGYFKASIPLETFKERNVFYLVLRTAEKQDKVLDVMQNIAKVSSVEYMPTLIGRALPGISLEYSLIPPPGLPTRPNSFYFKLDHSHPQWIEIQKSQSICLYWSKAPKDTKAEIIVLRK